MSSNITILCLALICVYNYFRSSRLHKRLATVEASLNEVAQAASSSGKDTGNAYV